eukprot:gene48510-65073_t
MPHRDHGRASDARHGGRVVARGVVEHVDPGFRQRRAKPRDHAGDRRRFVVAGKNDGDAVAAKLVHAPILDPLVLVALGFAGLLAGFVDAIAGGGGLIGVPALLAAGVPPILALGTNKVQGVIGTSMAAFTYWRGGFVSIRALSVAIVATYVAAILGAYVVKQIDVSVLKIAVPVALAGVALYFLFAPKLTDDDRQARLEWTVFLPVMGAVIGFYDGLLGPGTGSFMTAGSVALFGLG